MAKKVSRKKVTEIQQLILDLKMSPAEIARRFGRPEQHIHDMLANKRKPDMVILDSLRKLKESMIRINRV